MQIVIELDKDIIKSLNDGVGLTDCQYKSLVDAITNATPLPKGHGKLVDVNSIPEEDRGITVKGLLYPGTIACAGAIDLEEYVNSLPTIIEAESEGGYEKYRS